MHTLQMSGFRHRLSLLKDFRRRRRFQDNLVRDVLQYIINKYVCIRGTKKFVHYIYKVIVPHH